MRTKSMVKSFVTLKMLSNGWKMDGKMPRKFPRIKRRSSKKFRRIHMIWWQKSKTFHSLSFDEEDFSFRRYKIVKRDNDNVYFEKVPILSSLPAVQGEWFGEKNEVYLGISRSDSGEITSIWLSWSRCFRTGYFSKISADGEGKRMELCEKNLKILGYTFSNVRIQWRKSEVIAWNDRVNRAEKYRIAVRMSLEFFTFLSSELFSHAFNWIGFHWLMNIYLYHVNYSIVVLR